MKPTVEEQFKYRAKIRKLVRKIGREPEPEQMTFKRSEIKVIVAALACHDAVITLDMNKRKKQEQKKGQLRDEKH